MPARPASAPVSYARALAVVRQLPPAQQAKLVRVLNQEREVEIDTDARRVARRVQAADARITQADIDQQVRAMRTRRHAAGHHA